MRHPPDDPANDRLDDPADAPPDSRSDRDQPDRDRFEALYAANHDPILGYLLRRAGNVDDAADALAETFLTAWRRLADVPRGDEARLWLYGVARKVLAGQRRSRRRYGAVTEAVAAELRTGLDRLRGPEDGPDLAELRIAFGALSERDRELLALVAWEGLDHAQVAAVLGCSRAVVRVRLHRARRRLALALTTSAPDADPSVPPRRSFALTREQS